MHLLEDLGYFKQLQKAHLFVEAAALTDFCFTALVTNSLTYLPFLH